MKSSRKFLIIGLLTLATLGSQVSMMNLTAQADVESQVKDYETKLEDVSNKLAENQEQITKLQADITSRKNYTASQLRSAQVSSQDYGNIIYQMIFNGKSLTQALAMATIVNQSTNNIKTLSDQENQLEKNQTDMKSNQDQIKKIYDELNTKYAEQMKAQAEARNKENAQIGASPGPGGQIPVSATGSDQSGSDTKSSSDVNSGSVEGGDVATYAANKAAQMTGTNAADWYRIIMRESGGNPQAKNSSSSAYGLFQILDIHAGYYIGMSVDEQIAIAVRLYQAAGWSPWALTY